jgi:hypothetical protein
MIHWILRVDVSSTVSEVTVRTKTTPEKDNVPFRVRGLFRISDKFRLRPDERFGLKSNGYLICPSFLRSAMGTSDHTGVGWLAFDGGHVVGSVKWNEGQKMSTKLELIRSRLPMPGARRKLV